MSCGISMVKYILFIANLLCSISGILLIVFGASLFSNVHNLDDLSRAVRTEQIPVAAIVIGLAILIITFLGCCGAIRESYCMTMTYAVLLFILVIGQLIVVTYIWLQKEKFLQAVAESVDKAWEYRTRRADFMDAIQLQSECCGRESFGDYNFQGYYPRSCCRDPNNCSHATVYRRGCRQAFVEFWDRNSDYTKFILLIVSAVEIVALIFACCLGNSILNYERRASY